MKTFWFALILGVLAIILASQVSATNQTIFSSYAINCSRAGYKFCDTFSGAFMDSWTNDDAAEYVILNDRLSADDSSAAGVDIHFANAVLNVTAGANWCFEQKVGAESAFSGDSFYNYFSTNGEQAGSSSTFGYTGAGYVFGTLNGSKDLYGKANITFQYCKFGSDGNYSLLIYTNHTLLYNITTRKTVLNGGTDLRWGYLAHDPGRWYIHYTLVWNGTKEDAPYSNASAPAAPEGPYDVTFVGPTPPYGATNNTNLTINLTSTNNRTTLWIGTTPNLTTAHKVAVNESFNTTGYFLYYYNFSSEGIVYYKAAADGTSNTSTRTYIYDVTSPTLVIGGQISLTNASTNAYLASRTIGINVSDSISNIYALLVNLTYQNGTSYFSYENQSITTNKTFNYSTTLQFVGKPYGNYTLTIQAADPHTKRYIDMETEKSANKMRFKRGPEVFIENLDDAQVDYTKEFDRYTFTYNFTDKGRKWRVFDVYSDTLITYLENSGYPGHLVIWQPGMEEGTWVDFAADGTTIEKVQKLGEKRYRITIDTPDYITFHSIGGMNVNTQSYLLSWDYLGFNSTDFREVWITEYSHSVNVYINSTSGRNVTVIANTTVANGGADYNYSIYTNVPTNIGYTLFTHTYYTAGYNYTINLRAYDLGNESLPTNITLIMHPYVHTINVKDISNTLMTSIQGNYSYSSTLYETNPLSRDKREIARNVSYQTCITPIIPENYAYQCFNNTNDYAIDETNYSLALSFLNFTFDALVTGYIADSEGIKYNFSNVTSFFVNFSKGGQPLLAQGDDEMVFIRFRSTEGLDNWRLFDFTYNFTQQYMFINKDSSSLTESFHVITDHLTAQLWKPFFMRIQSTDAQFQQYVKIRQYFANINETNTPVLMSQIYSDSDGYGEFNAKEYSPYWYEFSKSGFRDLKTQYILAPNVQVGYYRSNPWLVKMIRNTESTTIVPYAMTNFYYDTTDDIYGAIVPDYDIFGNIKEYYYTTSYRKAHGYGEKKSVGYSAISASGANVYLGFGKDTRYITVSPGSEFNASRYDNITVLIYQKDDETGEVGDLVVNHTIYWYNNSKGISVLDTDDVDSISFFPKFYILIIIVLAFVVGLVFRTEQSAAGMHVFLIGCVLAITISRDMMALSIVGVVYYLARILRPLIGVS